MEQLSMGILYLGVHVPTNEWYDKEAYVEIIKADDERVFLP